MIRNFALLVALMLVFGLGCKNSDPDLGRVSGTITKGGQPVEKAVLEFFPKGGGRPSMAQSDANGRYEAFFRHHEPGATLGEHTIGFELLGGSPDMANPDDNKKKIKLSPDTIKVVAGDNEVNFELVPVN